LPNPISPYDPELTARRATAMQATACCGHVLCDSKIGFVNKAKRRQFARDPASTRHATAGFGPVESAEHRFLLFDTVATHPSLHRSRLWMTGCDLLSRFAL
jgi:hypothetical protein